MLRPVTIALLLLAAPRAFADARVLTVEDAERLALAQNPHLLSSRARADAGRNLARSARGRLLPSITVTDEYQHWDSPFRISIGAFGVPGANMSFLVRQADTNAFIASANQPLLGLLRRTAEWQSQRASTDAAVASVRVSEAALREAVRDGFLSYFQARAQREIAGASEEELAAQLREAEVRLRAGVITNADLLRVSVARANAAQQALDAETQAEAARANLLAALGMDPADPSVELAVPTRVLAASEQPLPVVTLATARALEHRPELAQARRTRDAAVEQRRARAFSLLPEIDAEGSYQRFDGQLFQPPNAAYVGVRASWTLWEWGASFYAYRAAAAQAEASAHDLDDTQQTVRAQVVVALARARSAASAVTVAQAAIGSAEEAYRVTDVLVQAGSATTTDLLDAQAALTTARLNLLRARYERAAAHTALERVLAE